VFTLCGCAKLMPCVISYRYEKFINQYENQSWLLYTLGNVAIYYNNKYIPKSNNNVIIIHIIIQYYPRIIIIIGAILLHQLLSFSVVIFVSYFDLWLLTDLNCQAIIWAGSFTGTLATAKTPCWGVYRTAVRRRESNPQLWTRNDAVEHQQILNTSIHHVLNMIKNVLNMINML